MDSEFGQAFLFLTNLAWKCRITLPVLVTAAFMVMDIRLQIEINIQAGQLAADADELNDESEASDESWEAIDSDGSDSEDEDDYEDINDSEDSNQKVVLEDKDKENCSTNC